MGDVSFSVPGKFLNTLNKTLPKQDYLNRINTVSYNDNRIKIIEHCLIIFPSITHESTNLTFV